MISSDVYSIHTEGVCDEDVSELFESLKNSEGYIILGIFVNKHSEHEGVLGMKVKTKTIVNLHNILQAESALKGLAEGCLSITSNVMDSMEDKDNG